MLTVERLHCRNAAYHVGWGKGEKYRPCQWRPYRRQYLERSYQYLKRSLTYYTMTLGNAYRILDANGRVILTLKLGHDGRLYAPETALWS